MQYTAETPQGSITYELTRKSVKNLNLRIQPDGTVTVSAPHHLPQQEIDAFVCKKARWIVRARQRALDTVQVAPPDFSCQIGDEVQLLGRTITIELGAGQPPASASQFGPGVLQGDHLILYPARSDTKGRMLAFRRFLDVYAQQLFDTLNDEIAPLFAPLGIPKVPVTGWWMRARWGSCHTGSQKIILNKFLVHPPLQCARYVLVHEYAHLVYPNHSAPFHALVQYMMPSAKEQKELLARYSPQYEKTIGISAKEP